MCIRDLKDQVGESKHYTAERIQPIELSGSQDNIIDAACFNINKYITRHPNKNGVEDVAKAYDYVNIIKSFVVGELAQPDTIEVEDYCEENGMSLAQKQILLLTEHLLRCHKSGHVVDIESIDLLLELIDDYKVDIYG